MMKFNCEEDNCVKLIKNRPPTDLHGYIAQNFKMEGNLQQYDIAQNKRLSLPVEMKAQFRSKEHLYSLFQSPVARVMSAKYEDENKSEQHHEENLDFKEEMEREARAVYTYFYARQVSSSTVETIHFHRDHG